MSTELAGARWWRFDFHTHTPASEDYGKGVGQQDLRKQSSKYFQPILTLAPLWH